MWRCCSGADSACVCLVCDTAPFSQALVICRLPSRDGTHAYGKRSYPHSGLSKKRDPARSCGLGSCQSACRGACLWSRWPAPRASPRDSAPRHRLRAPSGSAASATRMSNVRGTTPASSARDQGVCHPLCATITVGRLSHRRTYSLAPRSSRILVRLSSRIRSSSQPVSSCVISHSFSCRGRPSGKDLLLHCHRRFSLGCEQGAMLLPRYYSSRPP